MPIEQLRFSIPEILSLIGLAQCLYVLVYMFFRAGDVRRAVLPFLYFLALGLAFFLDFSDRFIGESTDYFNVLKWFFWFVGPPLSVLLIIQIARIKDVPGIGSFWVVFLIPLAYVGAVFMSLQDEECLFPVNCQILDEWLIVCGLIAGVISMVAIWRYRSMLEELYKEKVGQERYWLILTLIITNLFFLAVMLISLTPVLSSADAALIRTFLGLGLVYLAGTSLFRIYPQSLVLIERAESVEFTDEDRATAQKIENLLNLEKIYHEPAYSRTDLARELELPETIVSRIINHHFGKSFPQLLNERRVEDAKQLLRETDASIKLIAEEVGFNSTASFNRVFRSLAGMPPSAYRNSNKETE